MITYEFCSQTIDGARDHELQREIPTLDKIRRWRGDGKALTRQYLSPRRKS